MAEALQIEIVGPYVLRVRPNMGTIKLIGGAGHEFITMHDFYLDLRDEGMKFTAENPLTKNEN